MTSRPLYRAQAGNSEGHPRDCGHRHRKTVYAEACLEHFQPDHDAHVMVSEDGGSTWQRASRQELLDGRHRWEEETARRRARRKRRTSRR